LTGENGIYDGMQCPLIGIRGRCFGWPITSRARRDIRVRPCLPTDTRDPVPCCWLAMVMVGGAAVRHPMSLSACPPCP